MSIPALLFLKDTKANYERGFFREDESVFPENKPSISLCETDRNPKPQTGWEFSFFITFFSLYFLSLCFFVCLFFGLSCHMQRRHWHPSPVLLPGKSHGRRSLVGCSPWGRKESDTTEQLHFHFSLSCIGGGNGNPLQCSCLENPRDGGAWWAPIYGVV